MDHKLYTLPGHLCNIVFIVYIETDGLTSFHNTGVALLLELLFIESILIGSICD